MESFELQFNLKSHGNVFLLGHSCANDAGPQDAVVCNPCAHLACLVQPGGRNQTTALGMLESKKTLPHAL